MVTAINSDISITLIQLFLTRGLESLILAFVHIVIIQNVDCKMVMYNKITDGERS